jgi:hypothetical protein
MKNVTEKTESIVRNQDDVIRKMAETGMRIGKIYRQSFLKSQQTNPFFSKRERLTKQKDSKVFFTDFNQIFEQWFDSMEMYVDSYLNIQNLMDEQWKESQEAWVENLYETPIKFAEIQADNYNYVWDSIYAKWEGLEQSILPETVHESFNSYIKVFEDLLVYEN